VLLTEFSTKFCRALLANFETGNRKFRYLKAERTTTNPDADLSNGIRGITKHFSAFVEQSHRDDATLA